MKSFERKPETLLKWCITQDWLAGKNNLNLSKTKRWNYSQVRMQGVGGEIVMNSNFE